MKYHDEYNETLLKKIDEADEDIRKYREKGCAPIVMEMLEITKRNREKMWQDHQAVWRDVCYSSQSICACMMVVQ